MSLLSLSLSTCIYKSFCFGTASPRYIPPLKPLLQNFFRWTHRCLAKVQGQEQFDSVGVI